MRVFKDRHFHKTAFQLDTHLRFGFYPMLINRRPGSGDNWRGTYCFGAISREDAMDVYIFKLTVAQLRSIPPRFLGFLLASSHLTCSPSCPRS